MHVTGQCNCGGVKFKYEGTPGEVGYCHCKACQRQAGSTGSIYVMVDELAVDVYENKTMKMFVTVADSGLDVHRHFCGNCGSPIYSKCMAVPGKLFLKAGTFDDTSLVIPTVEVWTGEAQNWMPHLNDLPRHERAPS
ncbi:MAG: GFA family protein [Devosia sp.]